MVLLLQTAFTEIAAKSDQIESRRSEELVSAAMQGGLGRIGAMVADNSWWDAAVDNVYGQTVNAHWADENWGPSADDAKPYDGVFVLDEAGQMLWGTFRGQTVSTTRAFDLGEGFRALLRKDHGRIDQGLSSFTGLTMTEAGPAMAGVSLIRPAKGPFKTLGAKRRYIILTRHLTPAVIASTGQALKLEHFRLLKTPAPSEPAVLLTGSDGKVIGHLVWSAGHSGATAISAGRVEATQITFLVGILVIGLTSFALYAVHRLAKSEGEARDVSLTDALSRLPNRRAFYERLEAIGRQRSTPDVTVVFIDLDGFKHINDVHGHPVGDQLIQQLASDFATYVPSQALLARMGGDEFALLVHDPLSEAIALRFCQRVLNLLATPVRLEDRLLKPGASLGVATVNLGALPFQEVLRRADLAMYHAKETGKGRVVVYSSDLEDGRLFRDALEQSIRRGLEREEFDVVYQSIVDARTHKVAGVEALVRWPRRPEGAMAPDQFIPVAEESGLIQPLGLYVLDRACRELSTHRDLRLSVNVSPAQFHALDFEAAVMDIIARTGFEGRRLELEVTEGHLVENPERAIEVMTRLRDIGVHFSLDDFGTGYSSIGYLKRFPFDRIKIDKSLAGAVDFDPQAGALVAGTVHIAKALAMAVTAEGVETEHLAKSLRLAGCTSLQGYYFHKPGPLSSVLSNKASPLTRSADA